jgi:hypothetical protein
MTVVIDGQLGITTPALTSTVINTDILNLDGILTLSNTTNSNTVSLASGVNTASWQLTLPTGPGASGQFLATDGSGNTSWQTSAGSVSPGVITQLAFYAATGDIVSGAVNATLNAGALTLGVAGTAAGSVSLSGATSQTVTLAAAASAGNWTLTLPTSGGSVGQILRTDGSGVTSWITIPTASGIVNNGTANQLTYYAASGDTVSGNANATISSGALTLGVLGSVAGSLVLTGSTSGAITINTPATAGTWALTLPDNNGTNGQVLTTDGNGVTSWTNSSGSGTVNNGNTNELAYYSSTGIVVSGNTNVRATLGAMTLGVAGTAAGSLILSGATSGTVTLSTATIAGNWNLVLPATDGSNGQALVTDGSGNTSWAAVGGSGTVNSGNADELAYYSASGTAVSGNSNVRASAGTLTLGANGVAAGALQLSGSTLGLVTIAVGASAGTWTLTLPNSDGTSGQVLVTDGSGVTSWTTTTLTVGTSIVSGGTSGRILFNNVGVVGEKVVTGTGDAVLATTPKLVGLNETQTAPAISSNTLTLDCSTANVFYVTLNDNITTLTFTNVPTSGTSFALTLYFIADGTPRTVTWGASVKWPGGVAPSITSTNNKVDTFVLNTFDAGTTWYAFTAGQNS